VDAEVTARKECVGYVERFEGIVVKSEDGMGHLSNQWELRVSRMPRLGAQSVGCACGWMPLINIIYHSEVVLLEGGETVLFVDKTYFIVAC
jgi:hypothetical protein